MNKRNIILVGLKASGKTTIGQCYAKLTRRKFIDLDQVVIQLFQQHMNVNEHTPLTIFDIFKQIGERAYRAYECLAIQQSLQFFSIRGGVLATGSGTLLDKENTDFLRSYGKLFYLNLPFYTLLERWIQQEPQFIHLHKESDELKHYFHQRSHALDKAADISLDINHLNIEECAVLVRYYNSLKHLPKSNMENLDEYQL